MPESMNAVHFNKILVVDDTTANLQFLTNLLTEHGYVVYPASDGALALEFMQSILPDLILMDIRMPGLDGFEVCRQLKADKRTRDIPVIFISILEDERDKVKGFQEGAVDYVTKPFQPDEVLARIRIHLRLRELTENLEQTVLARTEELHAANARLQVELAERKRAEEALRKSHEELESRVQERTADLQKANEYLEYENLERRKAEHLLTLRSQELARSNEELKQFAYVASHDLQEPLRMVTSFLQLLENRYKNQLDANAEEFINYAVDGAKRMYTLINDLLKLSRVGTKEQSLMDTDCEAVLTKVISNLHVALQENNAAVSHDPLPVVWGDPTQLMQLFQNLIGNAIKFHGDQNPAIHIGAELKDHFWEFSVRDNGIGIEPDHFKRIFLVFQRLHGRSEYPGTGVGLAVCKKIVERHGGDIWLESEPGQGSVFYFTIPQNSAN